MYLKKKTKQKNDEKKSVFDKPQWPVELEAKLQSFCYSLYITHGGGGFCLALHVSASMRALWGEESCLS